MTDLTCYSADPLTVARGKLTDMMAKRGDHVGWEDHARVKTGLVG